MYQSVWVRDSDHASNLKLARRELFARLLLLKQKPQSVSSMMMLMPLFWWPGHHGKGQQLLLTFAGLVPGSGGRGLLLGRAFCIFCCAMASIMELKG